MLTHEACRNTLGSQVMPTEASFGTAASGPPVPNSPRVLTVVGGLGIGGTARCAQNYAVSLSQSALPSAVLAYNRGGPREEPLRRSGIPTFVEDISAALHWAPDVVHIHREGLEDPKSARVIEAFANSGAVIIETNVFGKPDYSPTARLIAVHLHLSEWGLWKWQRRVGNIRPRPTGIVFPYAVDGEAFRPLPSDGRAQARKDLGLARDSILLGRVGQPSEPSWAVDAIEAFGIAARKDNRLYLALVGAPTKVLAAVDQLDPLLRQRVFRLSALTSDDQLREFYSSIDCFLHSARIGESFGMVIMEALLSGAPVITRTRVLKGNTQALLVKHRETGLLVASTRGMVRAINEVVGDCDAYRRRTIQAREGLAERFSMDSIRPDLSDLVCAAASMDIAAFRSWCAERFVSTVDSHKLFRIARSAYGYRACSIEAARLAHHPGLYRLVVASSGRSSFFERWRRTGSFLSSVSPSREPTR
jgi:glycosyltransferase involved in cell wall biosynthesis